MSIELVLSELLSQGPIGTGQHSTPGVEPSASSNHQNFIDIDNISRQYFQLMVKLNEAPDLRSYFANEDYDAANHKWDITPYGLKESDDYLGPVLPDTLTRHFLTDGLVIYKVRKGAQVEKLIVITGDELKQENQEELEAKRAYLSERSDNDEYTIETVVRWTGCGMKIPENINLELDPDIVWPKVRINTNTPESHEINITNVANRITWSDRYEGDDGEKTDHGYIVSDKKYEQGQTKGVLKITKPVNFDNVHLTIPYTCASFDVLTGITINDEEELILFTT